MTYAGFIFNVAGNTKYTKSLVSFLGKLAKEKGCTYIDVNVSKDQKKINTIKELKKTKLKSTIGKVDLTTSDNNQFNIK